MTEVIQVQTTTATKEDAERIAANLLERRLAACVQVSGPLISRYWWQGALDSSQEWLCTIKTRRALYPQVEQAVRESHPYAEPEILAIPVVAGSPGYLEWLRQEVKPMAK